MEAPLLRCTTPFDTLPLRLFVVSLNYYSARNVRFRHYAEISVLLNRSFPLVHVATVQKYKLFICTFFVDHDPQ